MSSASLAVPRHAHPDSVRIAAMSAAIALNLAALMVVMRPMAPQLMAQAKQITELTVTWITPPPKVETPPAIELKPLPKLPVATPKPHAPPQPMTPPVVTPSDEGTMAAPPAIPTAVPSTSDTGVGTAPIEATLAYRSVPLKYPPQGIRIHAQGTVVLKVLVDEKGVPQDVTIDKSSGYALLDRSAREQVMQGWKFEPATVNGHAVRAWARVPVTFNLNEL
jgi:protein TonB